MRVWIALFRGINVGGKNILPMKELVKLLEDLECTGVQTYIQSGNAVFLHDVTDPEPLAVRIGQRVASSYGFEPEILLLGSDQLEAAVRRNPFPEGESEPSKLHLYFPTSPTAVVDREVVDRSKSASERFELVGGVAYMYAPDGIGRSKLAANIEKVLGVSGTGRNWRTVGKVLELARDAGGLPSGGA